MTYGEVRNMTAHSLHLELRNIHESYMTIYDMYYNDSNNRDTVFIKELIDSIVSISAILEVYARERVIHPDYVLEKLKRSRNIINAAMDYFERKGEQYFVKTKGSVLVGFGVLIMFVLLNSINNDLEESKQKMIIECREQDKIVAVFYTNSGDKYYGCKEVKYHE